MSSSFEMWLPGRHCWRRALLECCWWIFEAAKNPARSLFPENECGSKNKDVWNDNGVNSIIFFALERRAMCIYGKAALTALPQNHCCMEPCVVVLFCTGYHVVTSQQKSYHQQGLFFHYFGKTTFCLFSLTSKLWISSRNLILTAESSWQEPFGQWDWKVQEL